ncbi:hypothetical protein ACFYNN_31540 [Streptomyces sp. NPDC006978]|uniref:hypothetical protein n=1 Tax=Streptomyces sp. NPDC006978 TaxID=3364769 RepID=UPI00367FB421
MVVGRVSDQGAHHRLQSSRGQIDPVRQARRERPVLHPCAPRPPRGRPPRGARSVRLLPRRATAPARHRAHRGRQRGDTHDEHDPRTDRRPDGTGRGRIALLWSSRDAEEIIFAGELARLAQGFPDRLSVTHVLTRRDGRLDAAGVERRLARRHPAADAHYYVCGPEPLMDVIRSVLAGRGVPDEQVHRERYTSVADTGSAMTVPQEMTVEEDGRTSAR